MATSARIRRLNADYDERVYAGLQGKIMGVALARHHLGNALPLSASALGRIGYDITARGDFSASFADSGIAEALTAVRTLDDFGCSANFTSEQVAATWLNYAIENRAVSWWGGMGHSAAHTAFVRLKHGVPVPECGSIEHNGRAVAEQSGAEACADVWGLISPGDIDRAAEMAGKAARVCHAGEADCAAQAAAAFVASAFVPSNTIDAIVAAGECVVPRGCAVAQMIVDLRLWQAQGELWQHTRERILEKYGGSAFTDRHAVPHFAGAVMALLMGGGDLWASFSMLAASGFGTASNMGLVGCVLGVKNGLAGIDACSAWRAAIDDKLYLPSADAGRCVTDAATEALALCRIGRELQRVPCAALKKGAHFHFELPGSTQGFTAEMSSDSPGLAMLRNVAGHSRAGKRNLALIFSGVDANRPARLATAVMPPRERDRVGIGAFMLGSPVLYPGQTIRAYVEANAENQFQAGVRPFIRYYGEHDELRILRGPEKWLLPDARHEFQWTLPHGMDALNEDGTLVVRSGAARSSEQSVLLGRPIAEMGLEIFSDKPSEGVIYLDYVTWDGAPRVELGPPHDGGGAWRQAWVNAATQCEFGQGASVLRASQNDGTGLLIQGARNWRNYAALANVTPKLARSAGIAIRVQGLKRYYALLLCADKKLRLVKEFYGTTVLAEAEFNWEFGQTVELVLAAEDNRLAARANGCEVFMIEDSAHPLEGGAFALVVEEGCVESGPVRITPE